MCLTGVVNRDGTWKGEGRRIQARGHTPGGSAQGMAHLPR